jgi:glucose/arabinose dehydrogenase
MTAFALPLLVLFAAPQSGTGPLLALEPVVSGLVTPVALAAPPDGSGRLMILEHTTGRVRVVDNGVLLAEPLLDLGNEITVSGEEGLLGIAFHPAFAVNGRLFLAFNRLDGDVELAQFRMVPSANTCDPTTRKTLKIVPKPFPQHNGSMLAFGPDGYLYMTLGDGGSGFDPLGNAQNLASPLGKVLRFTFTTNGDLAVPPDNPFLGVPGALPEIWVYGLRNPWRCSFDRLTGDYWIGDVGQQQREEINRVPAGSGGGQNFGWVCFEGTLDTGKCSEPIVATDPVYEYDHSTGCAVIGGYVYRGNAIPAFQGHYIYSDYCTGQTWSFALVDGAVTDFQERTPELGGFQGLISAWGEDNDGELYLINYTGGRVDKLVPGTIIEDCDGDGVSDLEELLAGTAFDTNGNGVPDDCELLLSVENLVVGQTAQWTFIGAQPNQLVALLYSVRGIGFGPCYLEGTLCIDLNPFPAAGPLGVGILGLGLADAQGVYTYSLPIAPLAFTEPIAFQAVALDGTNSVKSNPIQQAIAFP